MREEDKVLILALLGSAILWVTVATLDALVLKGGSILDQLVFHVSAKDLLYRVVFMATFVVLAVYMSRLLLKSRKLEKELHGLALFSQQIISNVQDGIVVLDRRLNIQVWNRFMEQMTNMSQEEVLGKNALEVFPSLYKMVFDYTLKRALGGESMQIPDAQFNIPTMERSGYVSAVCGPNYDINGKVIGVIVVIREITERKMIEEKLKESENRFRILFEGAYDAIMIGEADTGRVLDANRSAEALFQRPKSELLNMNLVELHPTDDAGEYRKRLIECMKAGEAVPAELDVLAGDGRRLSVEEAISVVELAEGKKLIQCIFRDISWRKRAEEEMIKLAKFPDEDPYPVLRISKDGLLAYSNRSADPLLKRWGAQPGQRLHEDLCRVVSDVFVSGSRRSIEVPCDGEVFLLTFAPVMDGGYVNVYGANVTELKQMEQELKLYSEHLELLVKERTKELLEAERLAAIGEVTTMVGHDLRNPLQVLVNVSYLIKKKIMSSPACAKAAEKRGILNYMATLEKQVDYMNKIVSDLRDLAARLSPQMMNLSLRQIVEGTFALIDVPESIMVRVDVDEGLPKIMADPFMLRRVVTNLVMNAIQAMPDGGVLTVKASKEDEMMLLSVQDTGVGIPKENLDKIFQPFFTTKAKGQGLGLAVCKRMVEAHGGAIEVESELGAGTTFTIKLPYPSS